jgi:hypothetical protein
MIYHNTKMHAWAGRRQAAMLVWISGVRNIADTFYTNDKIDLLSGFGFIYNGVGDPPTLGVTLSMNF